MENLQENFKKKISRKFQERRKTDLTSSVCQILETIIRDSIKAHLDENNLLCDQQHGCRFGRSCCTQLLEVINDWSETVDGGARWTLVTWITGRRSTIIQQVSAFN